MSKIFDSIEVREDVERQVDRSFAIVDQIQSILEKKEKTQRDLANLLGKTESEISKWMTGTHNFTIMSIEKIETALGENILITPNEAVKKYSSTKMVQVRILSKLKVTTANKWKESTQNLYKNGLKSA